jgi:EAL domain-containing protein (putative c-di-GMP-specific phosphodiesterase class I)
MTGTARNAHDALTPKVAGHVFICYTREDSNDVDQLQRALQEAGITVWRDTADLWPGDDWRMKIRSAIDNNALVFLACFSSSSIARGRSYQNEELVLAIQQLLLRPPEQPWLIPVRFDDCEIPDRSIGDGRSFTSIQRADLFGDRYEHGLQRLIVAIQRILGRHADPAPADHRLQADADLAASPVMNVLEDLRRDIDSGEFELHYQPKVILGTGPTAGMEALVQWQHLVQGSMAPEQFIPLVEQSYLRQDITFQVVNKALAQAAAWWRDGLQVQVSMNVTARDLLNIDLAGSIGRALGRYELPSAALLLEISERLLTGAPTNESTAVDGLNALGVSLSLDDFGTGDASLVQLKRLPVSEVKIDSSFISSLLHSADDEVIVQCIVDLIRALGIDSVAEGVESAEVATALRVMGCKAAQGDHFCKPLDPLSATAWLAEHMPLPASEFMTPR